MVLHNPNNWHWVDKNCLPWARDYFASNLLVSGEDGDASAQVTRVKTVDGDVEVCQRKGKVISLFDVRVELAYSGKVNGEEVTGVIKVPEVAYDSDADDYQFQISIDNESPEKEPVKLVVRQKIVPQLRRRLHQFGVDLINTHGSDIQHAEKKTAAVLPKTPVAPVGHSTTESKEKGNTEKLTLTYEFTASAEQMYKVFLDPRQVEAWSRSVPVIKAEAGSQYKLFGGGLTGTIESLTKDKQIVMTWRLPSWKPQHYAILTLNFVQGSSGTDLTATWTGVPVGEDDVIRSHFDRYYVDPIKMTFGYGIPSGGLA